MTKNSENQDEIRLGNGPNPDDAHRARHETEFHKNGADAMLARVDQIMQILSILAVGAEEDPTCCCPMCANLRAMSYHMTQTLLSIDGDAAREELVGVFKDMADRSRLIAEKEESAGTA